MSLEMKIVGMLKNRELTATDLAARLTVSPRRLMRSLEYLENVDAIKAKGRGKYTIKD